MCGYVWGAKRSYLGSVFNFCYPAWCPGSKKSTKFDQNIFLPYWLQKDKNCVSNNVGIFWVQNWVIRARLLTFPAPVVQRLEKSLKLDQIIFQPYSRETIETEPQIV